MGIEILRTAVLWDTVKLKIKEFSVCLSFLIYMFTCLGSTFIEIKRLEKDKEGIKQDERKEEQELLNM